MRPSRLALPICGAALAALALSACASDPTQQAAKQLQQDASRAPSPAAVVPTQVASQVAKSDVGEYFVQPRADVSKQTVKATIAKLKLMPGVQSAVLNPQGLVDVQFYGQSTHQQHANAVKQMAAIGTVTEGV